MTRHLSIAAGLALIWILLSIAFGLIWGRVVYAGQDTPGRRADR